MPSAVLLFGCTGAHADTAQRRQRCAQWLSFTCALSHLGCHGEQAAPLCTDQHTLVGGGDGQDYVGLSEAEKRSIVSVQVVDRQGSKTAPCSGVVVSDGWVLTAKHCKGELVPTRALVSVGARSRCAEAQVWGKRVVMHDFLDLMAIQLSQPMPTLGVAAKPISVANGTQAHVLAGSMAVLGGYGLDGYGREGVRKLLVEVVSAVTDQFIEVDGLGVTGACAGDSGGPLLQRDAASGKVVVLGVLSTGAVSCVGRVAFVRLDAARDWLESIGVRVESAPATCGAIDDIGRCFGELSVYCEHGALQSNLCAAGQSCRFDPSRMRYACSADPGGPCGAYDQVGRCEEGVARYCEAGRLRVERCVGRGARCGRGRVDGVARCE